MWMPDGGNRPAYNVQLAVDTQSRAVVGVEVTNAGSDAGLGEPMREQVEQRSDNEVKEQLVDGGFAKLEAIDEATADDTTIYMPVPKPRKAGTDPHQPKRTDSPAVGDWRQRMATPQAKIYKQRAATIETVNGELKTARGMGRFLVRGPSRAVPWPSGA